MNKRKHRHNAKKVATSIRETVKLLARSAARHERGSKGLRKAVEAAIERLDKAGVEPSAAVAFCAAIVGKAECARCNATDREMSGPNCLQCAFTLRRIEVSRSFS